MTDSMNLAVPLKLDAFILNENVCAKDEREAKIAPITQPNYTFLQLDDSLIQHDILDHIDLHNAFPARTNPRLYDLGKEKARENRMGVYLHWVMPRFYRTGTAATESAAARHTEERRAKGLGTTPPKDTKDFSTPAFRALPNRWLVIRKLDPNSIEPKRASIKTVDAWVVESDRVRSIDNPDLIDKDLQVDISPYITTNNESVDNVKLAKQAEIFIGYKQSADDWQELDLDTTPPANKPERVDLTAVSSSNQLFLDYQPHCSNAFSTVDSFECTVDDSPSRLTSAKADYYVIGWHSDAKKGPLGDLKPELGLSRRDRLNALEMELPGKDLPEEVTKWLDLQNAGQSLCHGAMYNVVWNRSKRPENVPANKASEQLLDAMPVTVGTTPIDSLLAYIDSHQQEVDNEEEARKRLEKDLHLLGPLLRAQDEGVSAQRAAMDKVQNWNFARESGGSHWHLQSKEGEKVKKPSDSEIGNLEKLNNAQRVLDSTKRQLVEMRWTLFSYWWRYFSATPGNKKPPPPDYLTQVKSFETIILNQSKLIKDVLLPKFPQKPQQAVLPEFSEPRDPTLLVGGIKAGWPDDYLEKLKVRLDCQFVKSGEKLDKTPYGITKLPAGLQGTAGGLVREFVKLSDTTFKPPESQWPPLYHDRGIHGQEGKDPLRDQWNGTQPWAPLFLEWGTEYFHIPWDDWDMIEEQKDGFDSQWRLGISPNVDLLKAPINDSRPLSGRILLLPQPNFSLQTAIDQLFNSVSPDVLKKYLDEEGQKLIRKNTWQLPFLSAPLSGFNDHLRTMVQGTHIKPNVRYPRDAGYDKEGVHPIAEAENSDFTKDHLKVIDVYSDVTPYGAYLANSTTVLNAEQPAQERKPCPFKPVAHGQFRFSKLNIIDKFGQVINAIDARYGHEDEQAVYPHLSSYYEPQMFKGKPNLVRNNQPGHVEFAQVPPSINQPARLNASFVKYDKRHSGDTKNDYSYWRPVAEWENPIWGWVVLNYVDYGIQLFLHDGTFYREVRLASPNAPRHIAASSKWLPFSPPPKQDTVQLDNLIQLLSKSDDYLHAFLNMVNTSLESTASTAPSAYSGFLSSLVGRPLALVNAGWSLELSTNAKVNQADPDSQTVDTPPIHLIPQKTNQSQYEFPIKLGDKDRDSDGLVGLFNLKNPNPNQDLTPGDELELGKIYTYYKDNDKSDILQSIEPKNLPKLPCFWINPQDLKSRDKDEDKDDEKKSRKYARIWNDHLKVFGALMDSFLPITAFSSILPRSNLRLPEWTWQDALQRMTAFFHLGPIIVTEDVEKYRNQGKPLPSDYRLDNPALDPTIPNSAVGMPSLQTGNWAWLQPFTEDGKTDPEYKSLGLGKLDNRPKFERGPYTAIEGYLQLKQPIVRPDNSK